MKKTIIEIDACELDRLVKDTFGLEFNTPYNIMIDQRKITIFVDKATKEQKELVDKFIAGGPNAFEETVKAAETVEATEEVFLSIVNTLCSKKKLKAGEYILCFDD